MPTYSIGDVDRREVLAMLATVAASMVVPARLAVAQTSLPRTPGQILGPFYPLKPLRATSDLTRVPGRSGRAEGHILNVMGRVLNLSGDPVRNATVEVWQANAHGRYTHPSDQNPAALDPNFDGSATLSTDAEGRYRFQNSQACRISGGAESDAARAHSLPGHRPAGQACHTVVLRRRSVQRNRPIPEQRSAERASYHEVVGSSFGVRTGFEDRPIRYRAL
jgi:hypothetical protein